MNSYILNTTARNVAGFTHQALLVNDEKNNHLRVVHNAPGNVNAWGGNVTEEPFDAFMEGRSMLSIEPAQVTPEQIKKGIEDTKAKRFSAAKFNCEHFISQLISGKPMSAQGMQFVRLLDVIAIGPIVTVVGIRTKSPIVMLIGIATIIYNGYNYIATDRLTSTGLGDSVRNLIDNATLGKIKHCLPCEQRQQSLNENFPYPIPPLKTDLL